MVVMSRLWSGRAGMQTVDLATRWPLYLMSSSEPLVMLLLVGGQPQMPVWRVVVLLLVTVAHTVACVALLHAGLAHFLGGPRPSARLVGVAVALTAAGLTASVAAFPGAGRAAGGAFQLGLPVGGSLLLFCAAFTGGATPLLPARRLFAAVALPAAVAGVLPIALDTQGRPLWAMNYLMCVGGVALAYRPTVWILGVLWEMDRARAVQARLAVAEERLRFARDLHDVLGRNLALIALSSELAAELVRRGQDGAVEHMQQVRQVAQDSMREMREVVGGYRSVDLGVELAGARAVLRSAGIKARLIGDGAELPPAAQTALGWVVREATTNIIRHADPTAVTIQLDVVHDIGTEPAAVLRIENDGVRPPSPSAGAGAGSGLVGLRERLAGLGGDLTAEAVAGNRFRVQSRLPLTAAAPTIAAAEPVP